MEMSATISELAKALCKAQSVMDTAKKDSTNPHFNSKYADLASVWDACRKAITDNGLSVSQFPETDEHGRVAVTTMVMHTSGEWLRGTLSGAPKDTTNPQVLVSICTYLRRTGLSSAVGVAPDDDDDGNAATGNKADAKKPVPAAAATAASPPPAGPGATPAPASEESEEDVRKLLMDVCLEITAYTGMTFLEVLHAVSANKEGKYGVASIDDLKWTMKTKAGKDWSPLKSVLSKAKDWRDQEAAKGVNPGGSDVPV